MSSRPSSPDPFAGAAPLLEPSAPPPAVPGFQFAGVACGIKNSGAPDLALLSCPAGATAAGLFTENQIVAAPVVLSRARLSASPRVRALVVNSGNANACTGAQGMRDAEEMGALTATGLGCAADEVQVSSTGVIGAPLPMERLRAGIPAAADALQPGGLLDFAEAIRTTDQRRKVSALTVEGGARSYQIAGCAKGAGMIHPNMATMLAFICSDAAVEEERLRTIWREIAGRTFNAISVDGDTSTNDCAQLFCSGAGGAAPLRGAALERWAEGVEAVALALALAIVGEGEGVKHTVAFQVSGARSPEEARQVAETIAGSALVKTAVHGRDPNWGRIIAAAGRSGVPLEPERLCLSIAGTAIYEEGRWWGAEAERRASEAMSAARYPITLDLGLGGASSTLYGADLSADYVRINADYRS